MSEPRDPLRSLFRQAADFGQDRAEPVPAARIAERGRRAHRRRVAVLAVTACLAVAGGGAAAANLLPDRPGPTIPAVTPSPRTSPAELPDRTAPPTPSTTPTSRSTEGASVAPTTGVPSGGDPTDPPPSPSDTPSTTRPPDRPDSTETGGGTGTGTGDPEATAPPATSTTEAR